MDIHNFERGGWVSLLLVYDKCTSILPHPPHATLLNTPIHTVYFNFARFIRSLITLTTFCAKMEHVNHKAMMEGRENEKSTN